jgi:serine/threonine-protein kinase
VHPFAGKTTAQQLIAAHLSEPPAPLARVAPGVPPVVAALVMRCLAKDRDDRPAAAGELVAALRPWAGGGTTGEQVGAARRRWGRSWRRSAAGGLGALLVLVLGGWYLTPVELRDSLWTLVTRPAPTLRVNRVVVAPFKDETRDPRLAALGALAATT